MTLLQIVKHQLLSIFLISLAVIGVRIIVNFLIPIVILNIVIDFLVQSPIMVIVICIRIEIVFYIDIFGLFGFFVMGITKELDLDIVFAHIILHADSMAILLVNPFIVAVLIGDCEVYHSIGIDFMAPLIDYLDCDVTLIVKYTVISGYFNFNLFLCKNRAQSSADTLILTFSFAKTGLASKMHTARIAKMMMIFLSIIITVLNLLQILFKY